MALRVGVTRGTEGRCNSAAKKNIFLQVPEENYKKSKTKPKCAFLGHRGSIGLSKFPERVGSYMLLSEHLFLYDPMRYMMAS